MLQPLAMRQTTRHPGCRHALRAAVAALVWAAALRAGAQSTLGGGRGTLLVPDADTVPPSQFTTSFGAELGGASREGYRAAPVGVTFGFWNDLDVGLGLRAWSQSDPEAHGASVNARLSLKLRLISETPRRPALALALAVDHPFQGFDLSPSIIVHKNFGPVLLTSELGWALPLRGGAAYGAAPFAGMGVGYWLSASTSFFAQALAEGGSDRRLWLMPGVAWSLLGPDHLERRREALREKAKAAVAALEAELGTRVEVAPQKADLSVPMPTSAPALGGRVARLASPGRFTLFVTGGPALGPRSGWQVLAGIQISSFDEFLQDSDGDGIPDRVDRCPYEPEDWDGYQDEDGCPDHGIAVLRKLTLDRLAAAAQEPTLTTPFPRFRLRIPEGKVPDRERSLGAGAPMYRALDAPPPKPAPAPAPAAPPPGAAGPGRPSTQGPERAPKLAPAATPEASSLSPARAAGAVAAVTVASLPTPRGQAGEARAQARVTVAVVVLPPSSILMRPAPLIHVRRHPALAGERASVASELAAIAVARFQTPEQPLSDPDRESIETAIRAAGAEGGELLVWARARAPDLLHEATRRADAILALAARYGVLATTRVTTSPETAERVDVQVSATTSRLRLPEAATPGLELRAAWLESGDAGRGQLREAALAYRGEIERCLALGLDGLRGEVAEALVRVAVEPDGSAVVALRRDSPLWRREVDGCLSAAARGWRFPLADRGYLFDLPVSVRSQGGAR
jgi:hypothetical protein